MMKYSCKMVSDSSENELDETKLASHDIKCFYLFLLNNLMNGLKKHIDNPRYDINLDGEEAKRAYDEGKECLDEMMARVRMANSYLNTDGFEAGEDEASYCYKLNSCIADYLERVLSPMQKDLVEWYFGSGYYVRRVLTDMERDLMQAAYTSVVLNAKKLIAVVHLLPY